MKSFMYMIMRTKTKRNGMRDGVVKLWTIKKNTPAFVGDYHFTFESDNQALMNAAKKFKLLPRRYFDEHHPMGGMSWDPLRLREEKIADFHHL